MFAKIVQCLAAETEVEDSSLSWRLLWMRYFVTGAMIALLIATWPLWAAQSVFPQIPFTGSATAMPLWCDSAILWLAVILFTLALFSPPQSRYWMWPMFAGAMLISISVLLNQHRFQPWAYQLSLAAIALSLCKDRAALSLLRILAISIYLHSALSKLDASFLTTFGPGLIDELLSVFGINATEWSPRTRGVVAALLPLGELAVAIGLMFRRTRQLAVCGALVMHGLLLLTLGPLGMDHEPGVLLWNVYFLLQTFVLFRQKQESVVESNTKHDAEPAVPPLDEKTKMTAIMMAFVILLPFLEPWGWFDTWPSWAVYATRPERVRVFMRPKSVSKMPDSLQPHISQPDWHDWCRVKLDRWSLDVLKAPIYPQSRFQVAVALALSLQKPIGENDIRIVIERSANRWTGQRGSAIDLVGTAAIAEFAQQYRLNIKPRVAETGSAEKPNPRDRL